MWPIARILQPERGGDGDHLAQCALIPATEDHSSESRIDREPAELLTELRQPSAVVEGAKLLEDPVAFIDRTLLRRIEERKALDVAETQRLHAQDHRRETDPLDLRIGVARAAVVVLLLVEPEAHATLGPPAPPLPLVGAGLRDWLDQELGDAGAHVVAVHARHARVDDVDDSRNRQRGLGDIGREHDAPLRHGLEHALLVGRRQPGVERQQLRVRQCTLFELDHRFADLALARKKHEYVIARIELGDLVDRVRDCVGEISLVLARRPIQHLDGIGPARDFDHRCVAEEFGEPLGLESRRADDHAQLWSAWQQLLQEPEKEVDVEAALVRLVDDDRVVHAQHRIALDLGEQDAVRHELHVRGLLDLVVEANLVADHVTELGVELVGDARRHAGCRNPTGLRAADVRMRRAPHREADLR